MLKFLLIPLAFLPFWLIFKLNDLAGESVLRKRGYKCPKCGGNRISMKGTFRDFSNECKCKDCGHKFTIYRQY